MTTASAPRRSHPLHARRDVLLLVAPAAIYLVVFSVFPLLYSLGISFFDWSQTTSTFTFIGLDNYARLAADPVFWQAVVNTAVLVVAAVAIQVVLGTALALFFDLHLRGSWFVRGVLILPMLLTPVVVGLMWRALLNPDWGMVNWVLGELGLPQPLWLADPKLALITLVLVDSWQWTPFIMVIVFARLQALPRDVFEASAVDGAGRIATLRQVTLPLLAPAIVFAAVFRSIDAFRSFDVVFGLTYGGPGRLTTTMSFYAWETGFSFTRYGYASAIAYVMVVVATVAFSVFAARVALRRADAA
ncbi:MAG: sugar ABC transporter permease [Chloroflexota bacterium]|jgi:multiple sugar transport system permease protein